MKRTSFLVLLLLSCSIVFAQDNWPEHIVAANTENPLKSIPFDLEGDGDLDVLFTMPGGNRVAYFENLGGGAFGAQKIITNEAFGVWGIATADLDGDGDQDVLSASRNDHKIALYLNNGNGVFGPQVVLSNTSYGAYSIYAEDLDADGDQDILTVSVEEGKIEWFENDGNGNFEAPTLIESGIEVLLFVYAHDLNGDGHPDVVVCSGQSNDRIFWYENDGTGTFAPSQTVTTSANDPLAVFAADLDGDGDPDLLSASSYDDKIAWYENDGAGNFGPQINLSLSADGANAVYAQDMDGDGDLDVISCSFNDDKLAWYRNQGSGVFSGQIILSTEVDSPRSAFAADVESDGDMDVVVVSHIGNYLAWFDNDGEENFGEPKIFSKDVEGAEDVHVADLDGDGDLDILAAASSANKIVYYENVGNGIFGPENMISSNMLNVQSVHAADFDNDGDVDVLSGSRTDDKIAWYENDGAGNFGPQIIISLQANGPREVHAADVDSDGDMDVLSASAFDDKIAWYENDGAGNFGPQIVISVEARNACGVHDSDIDGDGDLDVVSCSQDDDKVAWYANDGNGNFGPQQIISPFMTDVFSVHSEDLDGDGDMDVLATLFYDFRVVWFENDGTGGFGPQNIIATSVNRPRDVFAADVDADGDMDVLAALFWDDAVMCYENDGTGNFENEYIIADDTNGASALLAEDIDGDGDMDVISTSFFDHKVSWHENQVRDGCLDEEACNYDPNALSDNNSCCYDICGCTDPNAQNFNPAAVCESGACSYTTIGLVFFDENFNGVFDPEDYGLPNQEVVSSNGDIYFTNDSGEFYATLGGEATTISLVENELFPYTSTATSYLFEEGINQETGGFDLQFGVNTLFNDFAIDVVLYAVGIGYSCDDWIPHNLHFRNTGTQIIDGYVEVEYHSLFQGYMPISPIDSVVGNSVFFGFEQLLPGQLFSYKLDLRTPTVEHLGEILTSKMRVYGFDENELVAYGEDELSKEVLCAYDPNDKQVFPAGFAEPHYVLPETELEYLVRFQNTGNATATHVVVSDTIDEGLDLATFSLVANSHSVYTTIKPEERVVEFYFENIMLPDSGNNEPESHGLVSFSILPYANLPFETEINNTAYIYFDNNPAIVTNTTWTTIYECTDQLAHFVLPETSPCLGQELVFESATPYVENYLWNIDENIISENAVAYFVPQEFQNYNISLMASNPLCNAAHTEVFTPTWLVGDANTDGLVSISDLLQVSANLGCNGGCPPTIDMDGNGLVGVSDMLLVVSNLGLQCE